MDSPEVVIPEYAAKPLRLTPFRGLMLARGRRADPAAVRAFARPYREVTWRLSRWIDAGQVVRSERPAVYLHEYTSGGLTIRGLVGLIDVSRRATDPDQRAILPHEGVHPRQVTELAEKMTELGVNPAPILLVHRGPAAIRHLLDELMAQQPPEHDYTDRTKQRHRIWPIEDRDQLELIDRHLGDAHAVIADGHHRYAAYLQLQRSNPGTGWDRGLAMLVDQDDTPLFLGAIHRILHGVDVAALRTAVGTVDELGFADCGTQEALGVLAPDTVVATDGHRWAALRFLPRWLPRDPRHPADRAVVEVVHHRVLPALPGGVPAISYHHSVEQALRQARSGQGLALLMPAPDFDVVDRIVAGARLLPEKATSFQPKPTVGVLMRSPAEPGDATAEP